MTPDGFKMARHSVNTDCREEIPHPTVRREAKRPAVVSAFLLGFAVTATPAWGVQTHGGVEGLVSHQLGHLLFASGMVYLLFRLYAMRIKGIGWAHFRIFLWLLLAWNVLTFSGHWLDQFETGDNLIREGSRMIGYTVTGFRGALFYLTRLDHLILVPAGIFLLLALRRWRDAS